MIVVFSCICVVYANIVNGFTYVFINIDKDIIKRDRDRKRKVNGKNLAKF